MQKVSSLVCKDPFSIAQQEFLRQILKIFSSNGFSFTLSAITRTVYVNMFLSYLKQIFHFMVT